MRGTLLAEIGELRGLHSKELESIKAFITRTTERWVPKFKEFTAEFQRRLVFVGTTNQDEFLADHTGNRRWLPVRVGQADVEGIKKARVQLWAEARGLFREVGVDWKEADALAPAVHKDHEMTDPWAEIIQAWLDEPDALTGKKPRDCEFLLNSDVWRGALNLTAGAVRQGEKLRIGKILRDCGFVVKKKRVNGAPGNVWVLSVPVCSDLV